MLRNISILLLIITSSIWIEAHAEDGLSTQGIMATSKLAGACGILDAMLYFQNTTKLEGGNNFVARFWASEAARLGLTLQQYSDHCDSAIDAYDKLWNATESHSRY